MPPACPAPRASGRRSQGATRRSAAPALSHPLAMLGAAMAASRRREVRDGRRAGSPAEEAGGRGRGARPEDRRVRGCARAQACRCRRSSASSCWTRVRSAASSSSRASGAVPDGCAAVSSRSITSSVETPSACASDWALRTVGVVRPSIQRLAVCWLTPMATARSRWRHPLSAIRSRNHAPKSPVTHVVVPECS